MEVISARLPYQGACEGQWQGGHGPCERHAPDHCLASPPPAEAGSLKALDYLKLVAATKGFSWPMTEQKERVKIFDFEQELGQCLHTFSHGMYKRLAVIASLSPWAEIDFFDEIFNGIDLPTMKKLKDFIHRLAGQGRTRRDSPDKPPCSACFIVLVRDLC